MAIEPVEVDQVLQKCLEDILAGRETIDTALAACPHLSEQLRLDLEAAIWFRTQGSIFDPRPGFISASRGRLVNHIRHETQPAEYQERGFFLFLSNWQKPTLLLRMAAIMAFIVFAIFGTSGIAHASQNALPGDSLYRVKIGLEDISLALSTNSVKDANLHIEFARRRLLEMQMLTLEGRFDGIAPLTEGYQHHLSAALLVMSELPEKDPANLHALAVSLQNTVSGQTQFMDFLSNSVPADTKQSFEQIVDISNESLATVNDLLVLSADTPTLVSVPEESTASGTPTQVVDLVDTVAPVHSPLVWPSDATPVQTAILPPAITSIPTSSVETRLTLVPAFTLIPTESSPMLAPEVSETAVVKDDEPPEELKPTKKPKPTKEPKPTKPPKENRTPKIKAK